MAGPLDPALRALGQLDEPAFLGVVVRSVAWTAALFVIVAGGLGHAMALALNDHGWLAWLGPVFGVVFGVFAALFLFSPVAALVASLFVDRIAAAVEARHYPWLPPLQPAPLTQQLWDGLALGARVLAMQVLAVLLALLLPGLGFALGLVIGAWAIGRGLFVGVAMRRMQRPAAMQAYRDARLAVLLQGGAIAAAGLVPILNLVAPVLGIAAMVHVLHDRARPVVSPRPL